MSLARDVTTVGGATMVSRALAFLRDVLIAAILGAGSLADSLFVALQVPNLLRRLAAEGALNAAFVPCWLLQQQQGGPRAARRFSEAVLGTLGILVAGTAVLCALFAPALVAALAPGFADERTLFAVFYLRLAAPYIAIAGLVAVLAASLNAAGRVTVTAIAPVMFNAAMIAAAAGVAIAGVAPALAGAVLAAAMAVAGLLQLVTVGAAVARLDSPPLLPQPAFTPEVRRFYRALLPGVIAAAIPQFTLIAGTIVASASPAAVAWLTYSYRLYELPLGVISVAIAAVMTPAIAAHVAAGDRTAAAAAQSRAMEIALGLALPAAAGLVLLAVPIVGTLFERGAFGARDTAAVAGALAAIAIGIPGHALEKALAAVSFANGDTRTPMLTALAGLAAAAAGAMLLFPLYGHVGVALAIATGGFVSAALLGTILRRRRQLQTAAGSWRRLAAIAAATVLMALALLGLQALLARMGPLAAPIAMGLQVLLGAAVYLALLQWFGIMPVGALWRRDRPAP